jgi:hypothetical protein
MPFLYTMMRPEAVRAVFRANAAISSGGAGIAGALRPDLSRAVSAAIATLSAAPKRLVVGAFPLRTAAVIVRFVLGRGEVGVTPAEAARWRALWADGAADDPASPGAAAEVLAAAVGAWVGPGGRVVAGRPQPSFTTACQVLRAALLCADADRPVCAPAIVGALSGVNAAAVEFTLTKRSGRPVGLAGAALPGEVEQLIARLRAERLLSAAAVDDVAAAQRPLRAALARLAELPAGACTAVGHAIHTAMCTKGSLRAIEMRHPLVALISAAVCSGGDVAWVAVARAASPRLEVRAAARAAAMEWILANGWATTPLARGKLVAAAFGGTPGRQSGYGA